MTEEPTEQAPQRGMTAEEIVEGLRGLDADARAAAINALFPPADGSAGGLVIHVGTVSAHYACTSLVDTGRMFNVLLQVCEQFGTMMGMELNWTQKQDPGKIIVARG